MTVITWLIAFLTGVLASLGVGGGMILIIWMTAVLNTDQLQAQGINLLFFLPIALLSVILHKRNGLIRLRPLIPAIIAGCLSSFAGVAAAEFIGAELLKKIFAVFLIIIGIKTVVGVMKSG